MTSRLPVTDLAELFGVSIEAEDVETVGGLLAAGARPGADRRVRRPPWRGCRLTAESLAGRRNRIGTVTVEGPARSRPAARPRPDDGNGAV